MCSWCQGPRRGDHVYPGERYEDQVQRRLEEHEYHNVSVFDCMQNLCCEHPDFRDPDRMQHGAGGGRSAHLAATPQDRSSINAYLQQRNNFGTQIGD